MHRRGLSRGPLFGDFVIWLEAAGLGEFYWGQKGLTPGDIRRTLVGALIVGKRSDVLGIG